MIDQQDFRESLGHISGPSAQFDVPMWAAMAFARVLNIHKLVAISDNSDKNLVPFVAVVDGKIGTIKSISRTREGDYKIGVAFSGEAVPRTYEVKNIRGIHGV